MSPARSSPERVPARDGQMGSAEPADAHADDGTPQALHVVDPDSSQGAILDAAAECFRDYGFAAASIDDVARALNATKGRIYHHFRSKTDLFFAVYRRGMALNFAAVEPYSAGPSAGEKPLDRLTRMAIAHAIVLMAQMPYQRVLAQGVHMHQTGATTAAQRETLADLIQLRGRYEKMFRDAIADLVAAHALDVDDVPLATRSFLAVLNGSVYWYAPQQDDVAREQIELAIKQVTFALQGLGVNPPHKIFDAWSSDQTSPNTSD